MAIVNVQGQTGGGKQPKYAAGTFVVAGGSNGSIDTVSVTGLGFYPHMVAAGHASTLTVLAYGVCNNDGEVVASRANSSYGPLDPANFTPNADGFTMQFKKISVAITYNYWAIGW